VLRRIDETLEDKATVGGSGLAAARKLKAEISM